MHDSYNKIMYSYEENYLNKRPQALCNMCGRCCRVATTSIPYKELLIKAEDGDEAAKDFLSIFVPYESVEAAKAVDKDVVDNILNRLSEDNPLFKIEEVTFYHCKFIQDDNKCSNYENRPLLCRHCPSTPWSVVPPGCGFEGWLFWKREEAKERVRKAKEELIELKLLKTRPLHSDILEKINAVEAKLNKTIDLYKKYGSENW